MLGLRALLPVLALLATLLGATQSRAVLKPEAGRGMADGWGTLASRTFHYDQANGIRRIERGGLEPDVVYEYFRDPTAGTGLEGPHPTARYEEGEASSRVIYLFNARDEMTAAVQDPFGEAAVLGQYDYDASGQRVRHWDSDRGDVETFYNGANVVEERRPDGTPLARYTHAHGLLQMDAPGTAATYFHRDALGSVTEATNSATSDIVRYRTNPWGKLESPISAVDPNRQIFTGQEHDPRTGLIYFGARYYDPELGRFTTQDTYMGDSQLPQSLHRYLYAASNPGRFVDPDGRRFVNTEVRQNPPSSLYSVYSEDALYEMQDSRARFSCDGGECKILEGDEYLLEEERREGYERGLNAVRSNAPDLRRSPVFQYRMTTQGVLATTLASGVAVGVGVVAAEAAPLAAAYAGSEYVAAVEALDYAATNPWLQAGVEVLSAEGAPAYFWVTRAAGTAGAVTHLGNQALGLASDVWSSGKRSLSRLVGNSTEALDDAFRTSHLGRPGHSRGVTARGPPAPGGSATTALAKHPFAEGGTSLTTTAKLEEYRALGSTTYGSPEAGLYISPRGQIDELLASGASRKEIEVTLGLNENALGDGALVRIDIDNPFARRLRLPDPSTGNIHHRPGTGLTTGNLNEAVIDAPRIGSRGVRRSVVPGR